MPKKRKSKANIRTHMFQLRLSDLELDWVRMKAQDAGMSMAELGRRCILLRKIPQPPPKISRVSLQTYTELGCIGNNLNQLTKAVNTSILMGYPLPSTLQIIKLLTELQELLNQCRREIAFSDEKYLPILSKTSDDYSDELEDELSDDWQAD